MDVFCGIERRNAMIKIWKGLEMEGPVIGVYTMFICSDEVINDSLLCDVLKKNPEVKRLYFGAGKKSFVGVSNVSSSKWRSFCNYLETEFLIENIIIETHPDELLEFINKYDAPSVNFVNTRYNFPKMEGHIYFKTDNNSSVTVYSGMTRTSLSTLGSDNLFASDVLLYEKE